MIRKLGMLCAFTSLFSLTPALSQTCTTPEDTDSGTDNQNITVSVTDFSCATRVTDAYITGISINTEIGGNCPNWYYHTIEIDGVEYASQECEDSHNLDQYVFDFHSIDDISIVSKDNPNDGIGDNVNMSIEAELTYIITNCPPPGDFETSNLGAYSTSLEWNPNGSEAFWQIELLDLTAGDTATGTPTQLGIITDSIGLTGLTPENDYAVYLRANCITGDDTESLWLGPLLFTTLPSCQPLTNVSIDSVMDVTARGNWSSVESEWEIELVDITGGGTFNDAPTVLGLTDTTYAFTGLIPENTYSYKVRANCGVVDGNSQWSDAVTFTTDPTCVQPSEMVLNSISTSNISLSWTANDDESSWAIEVVDIDGGESFSGTVDHVSTDTTFLVPGLLANRTYNIYVSAICSASDTSYWTALGEVTTLCLPLSIPYVDSLNSWVSDCYEISNSGINDNWAAVGSNGIIESNSNNFSSGQVVFTTGEFDMVSQSVLSFDWSSNGENEVNNWTSVEYTIDNGGTWNEIWKKVGLDLDSDDGAGWNNPGSFVTASVLLPATLAGEIVQFRFVNNFTSWDDNFFLDLIKVDTVPDCNPAYDFVLDTIIGSNPTFSFTDVVGDNSTSWDYLITSDGPDITGNTTVTPFEVTGLTPGVNYTITLMTLCGTDSVESSSIDFVSPCGPVSFYSEGYEAYNGGQVPNCWNVFEIGDPWWAASVDVNTWLGGFNSTNSFRFSRGFLNSDNNFHITAITPELLNTSTNWMKFMHFTNDGDDGDQKLLVGYMTDYSDEQTFVALDTVEVEHNVWNEYVFKPQDFPAFTGNRIAIKGDLEGNNVDVIIDNFVYEEIPSCYYPDNVIIDSTTLDAVYGSIDPYNSTDALWEVELVNVTNGESFTGTPTDTLNTSIFLIDGLQSSSDYEMYVRTNCGTETSIWSLAYNFTTQCAPVTDFVQGWENGTTCWTLHNEATNQNSNNELLNFTVNSGSFTNYLNIGTNSIPSETHVYTATPELSNMAAGTHWITFNARNRWFTFTNAILEVGTMTDPNDPSTFTMLQEFEMSNSYQLFEYSFVSYTGSDSYIAMRMGTGNGGWRRVVLDDITWEEAPECALPNFLASDSVTDITANANWVPISADSSYYLEIVNISNGDSFTGVATDSTEDINYTFTGLTQNTEYAVKVRASCDTNWTDEIEFTTLTSFDVAVDDFVNLGTNSCQLSTTQEATITLTNLGAQEATNFDVYYSLDGITYINDGAFTGTIAPGEDTAYTLSNLFNFQGVDTTLFVATSLVGDTINMVNDSNSVNVIDNGDITLDLEVITGEWASEVSWFITDTAASTTVASFSSYFSSNTAHQHQVCLNVGVTYLMESFDTFGDGWNGGTYTLTRCGGVLVANNGGNPVTNDIGDSGGGPYLEDSEYFTVEECDDYDLAILSMDSLESDCGLSATEQAYLSVQNFGLEAIIPSYNALIEYNINGAAWSTLADIENLGAGADTLIALPTINMVTPITYTFDFRVVYSLDENSSNDSLSTEIESVDTYTDVDQDFEDAKSGWTPHIVAGTLHSWEWGTPTTPLVSATADGKAWVTHLDQNMLLDEQSYLLSPCFDFSGYTEDVEIAYDFIWTVAQFSGHTVRFQKSTDGGASWNFGTALARNTTEWTTRTILDNSLVGESDVKFRFILDNTFSNTSEGFGMDNFKAFEHVPYTDSTLSDLTVDNVTVPGFSPNVFDYVYEYPFGTTVVPTVDAVVNAPFFSSLTITQAPTLTDSATVVVVAEDTNYSATYTVHFEEGPADSNSYLSDLLVDGNSIASFDSTVMSYTINLPFGTTPVVPVTWVTSSTLATATIVNATSYPGASVVTVVAQDGSTSEYTVNFTVTPGDSVSSLSDLRVDNVPVPGFHADTLEYTVPVIGATTAVVSYTTTSTLATTTLSNPNPQAVPSSVIVTVMAQDSSTTDYTVHLIQPQSTDADLISLDYEETPGSGYISVPGFHKDTIEYTITLPFGAGVPTLEAEMSDTNSTMVITDALTLTDPSTVVVTAQDGSDKTYTVIWSETAANTNNNLASLSIANNTELVIAGTTNTNFDPAQNYYTAYLCDALWIPQLGGLHSATAQDPSSTVEVVLASNSSGITEIHCIAQSGDTNTYFINYVECVGQEELEEGTVSVYPNPSTGIFNIEVKDVVSQFDIEVYNSIGQKVFTNGYENSTEKVVVDLSTYADGLYHIIVKDSKSGRSTKEKISILK